MVEYVIAALDFVLSVCRTSGILSSPAKLTSNLSPSATLHPDKVSGHKVPFQSSTKGSADWCSYELKKVATLIEDVEKDEFAPASSWLLK